MNSKTRDRHEQFEPPATDTYSQNEPSGHHDEMLRKTEAAQFLGISYSEFKRREKSGLYISLLTNKAGRTVYRKSYLETRKRDLNRRVTKADHHAASQHDARTPMALVHSTVPSLHAKPVTFDPETEAKVFKELRKDQDLIRIVEELQIHSNVVKAIFAEWVALKRITGGFYVSGAAAKAIEDLQLDGFPVSSGEELAAALSAIADTAKPCAQCKKHPRRNAILCVPCEREEFQKRSTT